VPVAITNFCREAPFPERSQTNAYFWLVFFRRRKIRIAIALKPPVDALTPATVIAAFATHTGQIIAAPPDQNPDRYFPFFSARSFVRWLIIFQPSPKPFRKSAGTNPSA
jgi:hypothetical protein